MTIYLVYFRSINTKKGTKMAKREYTEKDLTLKLRNYIKVRRELIDQFVTEEMRIFCELKKKRKNKQFFKETKDV